MGVDNTDPDPSNPIPDGDNAWVNVTIPTATYFYTSKDKTDISSPTYKITNNSGRGVEVLYTSLDMSTTTDVSVTLDLVPTALGGDNKSVVSSSISLANNNTPVIGDATIAKLAPVSSIGGTDGGSFEYKYSGSIDEAVSTPVQTATYTLNLTFKALDEDAPLTLN